MREFTARGASLLSLTMAMILMIGAPALAHRDGCHRQHSCPSDSGTYVCGDTGNFSQCGYGPGGKPGRSSSGSSSSSSAPPADLTAPDDPQVGEVSTRGGEVAVQVSAERGSRIDVVDETSTAVASVRATGEAQTVRFRASDGAHTYNVVATDRAGNRSRLASFTATVDGTAPSLPRLKLQPATGRAVYSTVLITGERAARYAVRVARRGGAVIPNLNRDGVLTDGEDLVQVLAPNGEYDVAVFLTDAAGNQAEPARAPLTVALPAPTLELRRTSAANDGDVTVKITGPALGKGEVTFAAAAVAGSTAAFTLDDAGNGTVNVALADGVWTAAGTVADFQQRTASGRESDLLVDTIAPVMSASVDSERAKNAAIAVAFTVEPDTRVTVAGFPGGDQTVTEEGQQELVAQAEDGLYEILLTAVDEAGNKSTETLSLEVSHPLTLREALTALVVVALLAAGAFFGGRGLWRRREKMSEALWERKAKRERSQLTAAHAAAVAAHAAALAAHGRAVQEHQQAVRRFQDRTEQLRGLVSEAAQFDGTDEFALPVKVRNGERLYARCDGAGLVEMRKPNGTPTATVIETGVAYITNQRVLFDGDKNREWSWEKLLDSRHIGSDMTLMQVSNRQKASGLAYPGSGSVTVRRRLELARADYAGERQPLVAAAQRELDRHTQTPPVAPVPPPTEQPAPPYLPTADDLRIRAGKPVRQLPVQPSAADVDVADRAAADAR